MRCDVYRFGRVLTAVGFAGCGPLVLCMQITPLLAVPEQDESHVIYCSTSSGRGYPRVCCCLWCDERLRCKYARPVPAVRFSFFVFSFFFAMTIEICIFSDHRLLGYLLRRAERVWPTRKWCRFLITTVSRGKKLQYGLAVRPWRQPAN